ncbi:hypothetical protein KTR10_00450 [Candidatus Kaiserbacteria bacterium]|nr:hypothetical protein [Candidatus Kaiserbacteria bacterium]
MNLIDSNGITYIFKNGISPSKKYYMAPDVVEEVEMTQTIFGKKLPKNILRLSDIDEFDEPIYVNKYKEMLNNHGGRSFFNMTGFGDISILASVHTLIERFAALKKEQLFDPTETIYVFTGDVGLSKRIKNEFKSDIDIKSLSDIK